jgi:uncharacterized protein YkwD
MRESAASTGHRWIGRRAAALAGVLAAAILPQLVAVTADAAPATLNSVRLNGYEAALVNDINAARQAHGLRTLVVVAGASDVARRWSWHMAGARVLSHNPSLVSDIASAGSSAWTMIAENVGEASSTSPGQLFTAYMNSAPHRANILDPSARYIGIGVVERAGVAWNTMDFTNAYSTSYGVTRVPAAGLAMDRLAVTTTRTLASYESSSDERTASAGGGGVSASLAHFTGPTAADDRVYATFTRHTTTGHGDLLLRDALDLTSVRSLSLRASATNPLHRAVTVQVVLSRAYGAAVSLGYLTLGSTPTTTTFALPSTARTLMDTLTLRVQSGTLSTTGGSASVAVYSVALTV